MRRQHMKWSACRLQRALAVVAASFLVLAGCSVDDTPGGGVAGSGVPGSLRIATPWEIATLDPLAGDNWAPLFGYGESLLRSTPDGEPDPWVLESAEAVSETKWKLTVHEGVTFQNGKPCDAEAVAELMNFYLAENPVLKPMLPGAVAKATGSTTVMLTTTSPISNLPNILTSDTGFPVLDVDALKSAGDDKQALVDAGIYTGPYEVTELTSDHMVLERNDEYWQGDPALPGVEFKFISDPQARVFAVQSGEVDVAIYPPTEAAATLEDSTAHYVTAEHGTAGPRVVFNLERAPVDDVLVRRALSLGLDYEAIANDVMDGYFDVGEGMFPMQMPFAVANQVYDPEQAQDLLDRAGWVESGEGVRTKNGQPLELTLATYRTDPDLLTVALAMRSQLQEIGIALDIREVDSSSVLYERDFTDWHLAMLTSGYFGVVGDAVGVVQDYLTSDGANNFYHGLADPEIDALADELSETFDQEQRYDLLRELQELMIVEKAYTVVVAAKRWAAVVSDKWADYEVPENYLYVDWQTAP